jgi:hypothetical protein
MKKLLPLLLLLIGVCPVFSDEEGRNEPIVVEGDPEDATGEEPEIGLRLDDAAAIEMTALNG